MRWLRRLGPVALLLAGTGCDIVRDESSIVASVIGDPQQLANPLRDSNPPAAKAILGATAQGLLSYDARGGIVDALAESWIVEDGGQSYIFRLKRLAWPNGERVKAEQVTKLLRERMRANPVSLAGLAPQVRAMTDRVIEIRLEGALPTFLQVLAQPQFAILVKAGGTGPYHGKAEREGVQLLPVAPLSDEAPVPESDIPTIERRLLRAERGALALARFKSGDADLVLGGRFQHLPLVSAVGLAMTDVRADPVAGLFGLLITGKSDFLNDQAVRDALSQVIDRGAIATAIGLPGWRTTDHPLPASLGLDRQPSVPAWIAKPMPDRANTAKQVVARWIAANGEPPLLRIALPEGPGASLLFIRLARDFQSLGVMVDRVAPGEAADLTMIDEVAPFDSALWYLARLDCAAGVHCDPGASDLLAAARQARDEAEQARLLGEAEERIVAHVGYLPLGAPIRWAMAGRRLNGFQSSTRGIHPLNRLVTVPN